MVHFMRNVLSKVVRIGLWAVRRFGGGRYFPVRLCLVRGQRHFDAGRAALAVAGERSFRDFRKDATLDTRQFQMAFRLLRQFSAQISDAEKQGNHRSV